MKVKTVLFEAFPFFAKGAPFKRPVHKTILLVARDEKVGGND